MKKGFTIVEIIISIALIIIIGTVSSIFVIKKNKSNIESITKEILEAGSLYLKIELDNNGNNYDKEIYNGAKGVKIPLSNLVDKGYIDEELKKSVIDYAGSLDNDKDYYVIFIENNKYCEENQIVGLSSWMEKGNDIYLCDDYGDSKDNQSLSIIEKMILNNELNFNIPDLDNYKEEDAGLYILSEYNEYVFYYYGKVKNNYLKFNDKLWRIIRTNRDGSLRIVLDDVIELYLEKAKFIEGYHKGNYLIKEIESTGEKINITDKNISCFFLYNTAKWLCYLNGVDMSRDEKLKLGISPSNLLIPQDVYPVYIENPDKFELYSNLYTYSGSYYREELEKWGKNNLQKAVSFIANNFLYYVNGRNFRYNQRNFNCEETNSSSYTSETGIGFIGYKEYKLSGGSNSYLTDKNKSFFVSDFESDYHIFYYDNTVNTIRTKKQQESYASDTKILYQINSQNNATKITGDFTHTFVIEPSGIRPVINLKSGACYKGDGTKENPYVINDCNK